LFYECQVFGGYLRHLRENILAYQSEFEQVQTSLDVGQPEVGRFLFIAPIAMNLRRANEFYQKMDTVFKEIQEFILARSELHEKNLHGLLNCKL
jgi:dynactin complex subunit